MFKIWNPIIPSRLVNGTLSLGCGHPSCEPLRVRGSLVPSRLHAQRPPVEPVVQSLPLMPCTVRQRSTWSEFGVQAFGHRDVEAARRVHPPLVVRHRSAWMQARGCELLRLNACLGRPKAKRLVCFLTDNRPGEDVSASRTKVSVASFNSSFSPSPHHQLPNACTEP